MLCNNVRIHFKLKANLNTPQLRNNSFLYVHKIVYTYVINALHIPLLSSGKL